MAHITYKSCGIRKRTARELKHLSPQEKQEVRRAEKAVLEGYRKCERQHRKDIADAKKRESDYKKLLKRDELAAKRFRNKSKGYK